MVAFFCFVGGGGEGGWLVWFELVGWWIDKLVGCVWCGGWHLRFGFCYRYTLRTSPHSSQARRAVSSQVYALRSGGSPPCSTARISVGLASCAQ